MAIPIRKVQLRVASAAHRVNR